MSSLGRLEAVCLAHPVLKVVPGHVGLSAIDKRPTSEPVTVTTLGLRGDIQCDRAHHGGVDKAIYAMDAREFTYWERELDTELPSGVFGENLRIDSSSEWGIDDAEIGERWQIGGVRVEVTGPRNPCATFAHHMGEERWVRRFRDHGRPGVYLKVVEPGQVRVGDDVTLVDRPGHGVSVASWFAEPTPDKARAVLSMHDSGAITVAHYTLKYLIAAVHR
ncbi:MAG: MOSC domain-containing protein [Bowdeniella nasicola]|nr:MOSC domain-containing protein [Bowdeniella nasicola]